MNEYYYVERNTVSGKWDIVRKSTRAAVADFWKEEDANKKVKEFNRYEKSLKANDE